MHFRMNFWLRISYHLISLESFYCFQWCLDWLSFSVSFFPAHTRVKILPQVLLFYCACKCEFSNVNLSLLKKKKKKEIVMFLAHWEKKKHQKSKKRLERQRGNKLGKKYLKVQEGQNRRESLEGTDVLGNKKGKCNFWSRVKAWTH